MNIITISLGRDILKQGSRECERMQLYAKHCEALFIIVLTRVEHGYAGEAHIGNLHLYPTHSDSRFMMLWDAFRIGRKILRTIDSKSCVISSQDPLETGWLAWLLSHVTSAKLHIQVHGDYFSQYWVQKSLIRYIRRFFGLMLLRRAPAVRVVSERIKESLIARGIPHGRITILPIRSELERFILAHHTVGDHDPFIFLATSRFSYEKNIPLMIRAFHEVHKKFTYARLRLVGRGEEEKEVSACIKSLNLTSCVDIIPWTDTVEKEMQHADVFLLASDHEAYGLTLVEALAVGLPVITTDVGCVGEIVKDGIHGVVVPVRDERAFTNAMERMITDRNFREHASRAGKSTATPLAEISSDAYAEMWVASLSQP